MTETLDIDYLKGWIGREDEASERLEPELVRKFRAMYDEEPGRPQAGRSGRADDPSLPRPTVARESTLGPDGHPARGGFLPPVPLPRRMWAAWVGR